MIKRKKKRKNGKSDLEKMAKSVHLVNEEYTQKVAEELKKKGNKITNSSSHLSDEIEVDYKLPENKTILLKIRVFEDEYDGEYVASVYAGTQLVGMPDGKTAEEFVDNLDRRIIMVLDEIKHKRK